MSSVYLPDFRVEDVKLVLFMLYTGKTVINNGQKSTVESLISILDISKNFSIRNAKPEDEDFFPKLRLYFSEEMENDEDDGIFIVGTARAY